MRHRWIVALILVTSIIFSAGGAVLGYWVIPEKGTRAECIILANQLEDMSYRGTSQSPTSSSQLAGEVIDEYNHLCR